MLYLRYAATILLICTVLICTCKAQQADFEVVTKRVVADLKFKGNIISLNKSVARAQASLKPDGTWKDISYTDNSMAIWQPAIHLDRVKDMVMAYNNPNSAYHNNENIYANIVITLRYWNKADPQCKNWWFNQISCPQTLGQIILLMQAEKHLPAGLQDSLMKKMERGDMYKQTGANKYDVALHNLYSALLKRNVTLMDSSVSQCFQPVTLTTNTEGLQYDYSYLQHGPQLQVASYGTVFLVGEYKLAAYLSGTHWQLAAGKEKVLSGFLNHTFLTSIRFKYFDFSVMGRGFSRKDSGNSGALAGMADNINTLKLSDPKNITQFADYDDAVKRALGKVPASYNIKPAHYQYWVGDYTQHIAPGYLLTIRANSTRTRRTETGNGENLYGRYMSDGVTNIQRSGSEYYDIFPIWEYDKIPGVTCRDFKTDRPADKLWGQPGTTNFTGGVTDGLNGACTYSLSFDSVQAKKAWFFMGKQIICLGAGIQSNTPEHITTTINQCWSRGDVMFSPSKQAYWHDSIAYYALPGNMLKYTNTIQSGSWNKLNISQPTVMVSGKVFKLWIDHGTQPQNATYAYAIVPAITVSEFKSTNPFNKVNIVSNTAQSQVVLCPALNMLQAVFYQPVSIKAGALTLSTDQPCIVMLKSINQKNIEVFITDPSHKLETINLKVNGKVVVCKLPVKEYAGSTAQYSVRF
jgi:chondroitin AC lyase